jgi:hypothetical protein
MTRPRAADAVLAAAVVVAGGTAAAIGVDIATSATTPTLMTTRPSSTCARCSLLAELISDQGARRALA